MNLLNTAMIVSIVALLFATIFQLIQMRRTKSAKDISIFYVILLILNAWSTLALVIWTSANMKLIIKESIGCSLLLVFLIAVIYWKIKK